VLYLMTMIAAKAVLGIFVDTVLRGRDVEESAGERGSK